MLDEVNKQIAKLDSETVKLDEELRNTSASFTSSMKDISGELTVARRGLEGVQVEMREVSEGVKRIPSEASISKSVRHELGKRLLSDDDK